MFKVIMLSNKLWYVQHEPTKRYYFERYTQESDARMASDTLASMSEAKLSKTLQADFVPKTTHCYTVHNCIGETLKELSITNDSEGFWLVEHDETRLYFIYKFSDGDAAQKVADNMMRLWNDNPKAKAKAFNEGYFINDRSAVRERPRF